MIQCEIIWDFRTLWDVRDNPTELTYSVDNVNLWHSRPPQKKILEKSLCVAVDYPAACFNNYMH